MVIDEAMNHAGGVSVKGQSLRRVIAKRLVITFRRTITIVNNHAIMIDYD